MCLIWLSLSVKIGQNEFLQTDRMITANITVKYMFLYIGHYKNFTYIGSISYIGQYMAILISTDIWLHISQKIRPNYLGT